MNTSRPSVTLWLVLQECDLITKRNWSFTCNWFMHNE